MTPEKQRIAIAEARGFACKTPPYPGANKYWHVVTPAGTPLSHVFENEVIAWRNAIHIPDYLSDLNAMHEAEKAIKPIDVPHYSRELLDVTGASVALANGETWLNTYAMYHATAAQRAEAFLKCIGKWEDTPCTPTS